MSGEDELLTVLLPLLTVLRCAHPAYHILCGCGSVQAPIILEDGFPTGMRAEPLRVWPVASSAAMRLAARLQMPPPGEMVYVQDLIHYISRIHPRQMPGKSVLALFHHVSNDQFLCGHVFLAFAVKTPPPLIHLLCRTFADEAHARTMA